MFLDFLINLAPEGETFLIVKQKPRINNGMVEYHADGAIKATWPAYMPDHKMNKGAWYGNTASFIVDRFKDGRPSASAANCEYVLVMVLDDVGDPEKTSKIPPLKPTWKMETSPGSFQWGYAFREQPTKGEYAAAIRAIAEAGYTDPGAINPVRNFRLPGSVNLKPGRDEFEAVLVEFNPEVDYTLDEIVKAFDVQPGEPETDGRRVGLHLSSRMLAAAGDDDVLRWLADHGMVLTSANASGWYGVQCPNAHLHSDGDPEGRYLPSTRAFCCYHSHCHTIDSRAYLAWVAEQGGPEHKPGLREELFTEAMADLQAKLPAPSEEFPDKAAEVVARVEAQEAGRTAKNDWFRRFAYVQSDNCFFDLDTRRLVSRSAFDALFRHIECKSIHRTEKGGARRIEASVCYDENRQSMGARVVQGVTYAAGEGVLCARDGDAYGNLWRDGRPTLAQGDMDISPWMKHFKRLVPAFHEREHLLNVMAHNVQRPNAKLNHAVLHGGTSGCGKDTLWAPMLWAIGGDSLDNVQQLENDSIVSQWGYAYESEVIVLQELRQTEAKDRRHLENALKPIIAAPPEHLQVNKKNQHPYEVLNRLFVLAFSNERMPIALSSEDRRWFVIWSGGAPMSHEAASALWAWYKSGGFEAVAAHLRARDLSAFDPAARPPMTEAKHILIDMGRSGTESYLLEMMQERTGVFARGAVAAPWQALCSAIDARNPAGNRTPMPALLHALKESGWVDLGRVKSRQYPTKRHVFAAPDVVEQLTMTQIRALVEAPPDNLVRLAK